MGKNFGGGCAVCLAGSVMTTPRRINANTATAIGQATHVPGLVWLVAGVDHASSSSQDVGMNWTMSEIKLDNDSCL